VEQPERRFFAKNENDPATKKIEKKLFRTIQISYLTFCTCAGLGEKTRSSAFLSR
jgi:hypothetical protein